MNRSSRPYTKAEDETILKRMSEGWGYLRISRDIDRTWRSVSSRIRILPRRANSPETSDDEKPIELSRDDQLVAACLAQGGFPRAEVINGKTYWINYRNALWGSPMEGAA